MGAIRMSRGIVIWCHSLRFRLMRHSEYVRIARRSLQFVKTACERTAFVTAGHEILSSQRVCGRRLSEPCGTAATKFGNLRHREQVQRSGAATVLSMGGRSALSVSSLEDERDVDAKVLLTETTKPPECSQNTPP